MSPDYITIELTQGQTTVVDLEDADLADFKWYAWQSKCSGFYAMRNIRIGNKRGTERLARVILSRVLDRDLDSKEFVDHIDGNPLNNRRNNLRISTNAENCRNQKIRSTNTTGYAGVRWYKPYACYLARICVNGVETHLGYYDDIQDAIKARKEAEEKYFGEFRRKE